MFSSLFNSTNLLFKFQVFIIIKFQIKPLFTGDELEECDRMDGDECRPGVESNGSGGGSNELMLRRFDARTLKCTHKSYMNDTRFLMDVRLSAQEPTALCLRHDVDACVWQPHDVTTPSSACWLTHEHTFHAFGYVQASKQEAKFRLAPRDSSYACVVDARKHVFVYKQSADKVAGVLRNRKTGQVTSHVAKQYLISLDKDDEICGAYAANEFLLVLMPRDCFVFRINNTNSSTTTTKK